MPRNWQMDGLGRDHVAELPGGLELRTVVKKITLMTTLTEVWWDHNKFDDSFPPGFIIFVSPSRSMGKFFVPSACENRYSFHDLFLTF